MPVSPSDYADYDNQLPRILWTPPSSLSVAKRFIALGELCGCFLDPWEKFVLHEALKIDPTGGLLAMIVVLIIARQNGKGKILEVLGLGWLFITQDELILHSAHQFKTCADAYKRLKSLICQRPELADMVKNFSNSHGNEAIKMQDDREYKFIARGAGGSGRGFPAKKLILDEAFDLPDTVLEDVLPTLTAAENPQVWLTSSPVNKEKHPHGLALSKIRHRALKAIAAEQASTNLSYFEWSVPDELSVLDYGDRFWWKFANPGWDYRPNMAAVLQADFELMPLKSFGVEHLGKGDWFDPSDEGAVITVDQWHELLDEDSRIVGKRVFALDIAPYGKQAAIAVCGLNADGNLHVEVIKYGRGTGWVVDYLTTRCNNWSPLAVFYDPRTASASLEDALTDAKIPLEQIKGLQVSQAFSMFYDKCVQQKTVRHPDQPSITEALLGATTRTIGDGIAWDRREPKSDITGLVAITNALFGFSMKNSGYVDVAGSCW